MAKKADRQRPQVILEGGDAPETMDLAEVPNSILKQLLVAGSDAAWDEAIDRIAQKSARGDYRSAKETPSAQNDAPEPPQPDAQQRQPGTSRQGQPPKGQAAQ